jgi:hypothetical protein
MKRTSLARSAAVAACAILIAVGGVLAAADKPAAAPGSAAAPKPAKPNVPKGYKLLYSQSFDTPAALADFEFTNADKWKWAPLKPKGGGLESLGQGKYRPKVRSPRVIALISGHVFGDFVLEADLLQTGREYGHRDMCLFFGFTDPSRYYYVHMATKADKNAHNVFIVNLKPRTNIARKTTKGIKWGKDKWHHVRLERKAADGTIRVFFDDMKTPIMVASDKTFPAGCIGFGSFDDVGRIDNVRIWGPKVVRKKTEFFQKKPPAKTGAGEAGRKAR